MQTDDNRYTLLIVDDEPINISVLSDILKDKYRILAARNGEQALTRARGDITPDLILLDIMMPEMDGYEVCRRLKQDPQTAEIPVIFVTAMTQELDESAAFDVGAVDYITKPVRPAIVQARVRAQLELQWHRRRLSDDNRRLDEMVRERTAELYNTQQVTIHAMATLAETRDNETGNHIRRTQYYVKTLAEALREMGDYPELTDENIDLLYRSAPLHDIGKVGIPDAILLKPGKLDDAEFTIMKTHAELGGAAIDEAEKSLCNPDNSFLRYARQIAYCHHEKWDGSGYPQGLKGEDIPLAGRLMALADVYDALISRRAYKEPFTHERARELLLEGKGKHFDPAVVEAFLKVENSFIDIAKRFSDED
ncbi:response regulator [Marinobacterium mangrovicola]|uniref:Putative two-component system response regulator n=1 Tax=Marinobacterium mangrovicola TaxID=1476959 RepID=A0A4V2PDM1_9GAMM|nr:two-component system response regulator [Marinobacterium mangrovicola]TCK05636.1 putative two-component system response regulator [Marinobacterium mangrovicola]